MKKWFFTTALLFISGRVFCLQEQLFVENCLGHVTNSHLSDWLEQSTINTPRVFTCGDVSTALAIVNASRNWSVAALVTWSTASMIRSILQSKGQEGIRWTFTDHCLLHVQPFADSSLFVMKNNASSASLLPLMKLTDQLECLSGRSTQQQWTKQLQKVLNDLKWKKNTLNVQVIYLNPKNQTLDTEIWTFGEERQLFAKFPPVQKLSKTFYKVGVVQSPPVMSYSLDQQKKVLNPSGLVMDILNTLAHTLHFNLVAFNGYGSLDERGQWNGAVRGLVDKEIDLLAADLTKNPSRAVVVDFTVPFMQGSQRIVIRRSLQLTSTNELLRTHLKPFHWPIWLLMSLFLITATALYYYIEFSDRSSSKAAENSSKAAAAAKKKKNVKEVNVTARKDNARSEPWWAVFFYLFGFFCQQGCDLVPIHASGRIVMYTMCMTALVCYNFYTSVFISFTTVTKNVIPVNNLADVLRDKSFMVGFVKNNKVEDMLKITSSPVYQKAWSRMQKAENMYVENTSQGIARTLDEKFAFISDSYRLEWYTSNNCSFKMLQDKIFQEGYHFALPLHSPDSSVFSKYMKRIVESGMVTRMKMSHMPVLTIDRCKAELSLEAVGLDRMLGLFICLTSGFLLAVICLWLEKTFRRSTHRSMKKVLIRLEK